MHSFRGKIGPIIFDSSCLLRKATFLEDQFYAFDFLRAVYLFHHSYCHHPTLEVVYFFFFFTVRMALIHSLNDAIFIFNGELAVIHCLSNSFGSRYLFLRILASIHSFNGAVHFSDVKICSDPIWQTHFLSA